ncbi:MAG: hypothetical protein ACI9GW_000315 [Halieaceae bacterium]|jgi:hypothetical protein
MLPTIVSGIQEQQSVELRLAREFADDPGCVLEAFLYR